MASNADSSTCTYEEHVQNEIDLQKLKEIFWQLCWSECHLVFRRVCFSRKASQIITKSDPEIHHGPGSGTFGGPGSQGPSTKFLTHSSVNKNGLTSHHCTYICPQVTLNGI